MNRQWTQLETLPPDSLHWGLWGPRSSRSHCPNQTWICSLAWAREREQRRAIPHGWGRQCSTKHLLWPKQEPKSPGTRRLGTIVVRNYRVGRWKSRRGEMVCGLGREESGKLKVMKNKLTRMAIWPPESQEMSGTGLWHSPGLGPGSWSSWPVLHMEPWWHTTARVCTDVSDPCCH